MNKFKSEMKEISGNFINKNLYQSFITSFARYDYNINEEKILIAIVDSLQDIIKECIDIDSDELVSKMICSFESIDVDINVHGLFSNGSQIQYSLIDKAMLSLSKKDIVIEYVDKINGKDITKTVNLINGTIKIKNEHTIQVNVDKEVALCLIDISNGYKRFNLKYIMRMKSAYSMRIFKLISSNTGNDIFHCSIDTFKYKLCIDDKYSDNRNLRRLMNRIIDDINSDYVGWDNEVKFRIKKNMIYFDVKKKKDEWDNVTNRKYKSIQSMENIYGKNIVDTFRDVFCMTDEFINKNESNIRLFIRIYILGTSQPEKAINSIAAIISQEESKISKMRKAMAIIKTYNEMFKNNKV